MDTAAVISNGGRYHFEKVREVSEGGMLLATQRPLVAGHVIEVQFMLPNKQVVEARGEVIYGLTSDDGFFCEHVAANRA